MEIYEYAEALGPENVANRSLLMELTQLLPQLWPQLEVEQRRNDEQTDGELLSAWCQRLEGATHLVEAVRLAWISDVLDEEATPHAAR